MTQRTAIETGHLGAPRIGSRKRKIGMKKIRLTLAAFAAASLSLLVACSSELPDEGSATRANGDGDGDVANTGGAAASSGGASSSGGVPTSAGGTPTTGTGGAPVTATGDTCAHPAPLNDFYQPSGWMGDQTAIALDAVGDPCEERSSGAAVGDCYKVAVSPGIGADGWAGIFWQNQQDNWGDTGIAGCDLSDEPTITFMAKGAVGGEEVSFFAAGIPDDTLPPTVLTAEWQEYSIDLGLSSTAANMWGAFGFSLADEPGGTFYIDDIYIGGAGLGAGGAAN